MSKLDFRLFIITFSDWILGLSGKDFGWFIASLDPCNLLEESTVHTSCLGVHKSAKFVLVSFLEFSSLRLDSQTGTLSMISSHLIFQELLVSHNFLFERYASLFIFNFTFLSLLFLLVDERRVRAFFNILLHSALANLCSQHLV